MKTTNAANRENNWVAFKVAACTASKYAELGMDAGIRMASQAVVEISSGVDVIPPPNDKDLSPYRYDKHAREEWDRGFVAGLRWGRKVTLVTSADQ